MYGYKGKAGLFLVLLIFVTNVKKVQNLDCLGNWGGTWMNMNSVVSTANGSSEESRRDSCAA